MQHNYTEAELNKQTPPEQIKHWPLVVFAADRKKLGGACRIWFAARALDSDGSGKVEQSQLFELLRSQGVNERTRRRWLAVAKRAGLMSEGTPKDEHSYYFLTSLERAVILMGCDKSGVPASVPAEKFLSTGWKSYVLAAYESTLKQPMSQERKAAITGVHPRVQRLYHAGLPTRSMQNYAPAKIKKDHVTGASEVTGYHFFIYKKGRSRSKVIQRLPDIRVIPSEVAQSLRKGRSRKAQRAINAHKDNATSLQEQRGKGVFLRLFNRSPKETKATLRRIRKSGIAPEDAPSEIFQIRTTKGSANLWKAIPTSLSL